LTHRDVTPTKEQLVELRFDRGLTREGIAEHFNVSTATVRRWIKELKIPRPTRQATAKRPKHLSLNGEIVASLGDGYNDLERARIALEGRVVEFLGKGYYLDGKPASAEEVIAASR